jgi:2-dehydro-3-deoxy-D-arabinonate dehydratase
MLRIRYRDENGVQSGTVDSPEELDAYDLLLPVEPPEVWCAGVTYKRSRDARIEEAVAKDIYSLVYEAERPEFFLKDAAGRRTVGPGETIGVRSDSAWSVPEPEIALVLGEGGRIDGVTIGNDVSSRDIEGTNPLYLPQAKIYAGSCALGPAVLTEWEGPFEIRLRILEDGRELFAGETSTAQMQRSFEDLVDWLRRENPVPPGSVLLTGTGLVPPDEFNLQPGHVVEIEVPGIGTLRNPVGAAADLVTRRSETR